MPANESVSYVHDATGQLTSLTRNGVPTTYAITQQGQGGRFVANKRVNYNYNAAGQVSSMERHSHLTNPALVMASLNSYDNLGRAVFMQHYTPSLSFAMYTSAFDAAGRMTASGRTTAGGMPANESVSYVHDATGQLTSLTRNGVPTTYGYDATGNRNYGAYGVGANNRITTDGVYSYTYDNEGNITVKQKISNPAEATYCAYDHRNRLVAFSEFGPYAKNVLYEYDVFNRRIAKSIDKDGYAIAYGYVPTYFVYDTRSTQRLSTGDDIVLALKADGALANRYLHGPAVDEILADENQYGGVLWALRDQFYSVRDLIDHAGGHYNHFDYDAFGNVIGEMKLASQGHLVHAYGFQSRERDQESLLNYHRNRYYDAQIGRWRSEDPIGFDAGDVNLNRFVGNAPTRARDPHGLKVAIQAVSERGTAEWVDMARDDAFFKLVLRALNEIVGTCATLSFTNIEYQNTGNAKFNGVNQRMVYAEIAYKEKNSRYCRCNVCWQQLKAAIDHQKTLILKRDDDVNRFGSKPESKNGKWDPDADSYDVWVDLGPVRSYGKLIQRLAEGSLLFRPSASLYGMS